MNINKLLYRSLFVGGMLALMRLLFAKSSTTKSTIKKTSYDTIDDYILQQKHRLNIPGISLAIVEGDKIVHLRGFGITRPGGETPTPQTLFLIGSITKSVTALAVMQLVEAGKIKLDAPVQQYLPWFKVADPQASTQITIRHLLNQTSGMSFLSHTTICLTDSDSSPDAIERQARALTTLKLSRSVGTSFQYCNLNYNLLGLVIEVASEQSYAEYIKEHILVPLDMRHTYTYQVMAKQNDLAMGYRYWFGIPLPAPNIPFSLSEIPAGGLISTAEDMTHYLIAHLNGGFYDNVQVLSAAGINELQRGVAQQRIMGKSVATYGMGWFVNKLDDTTLVSHGGNTPNFSAFIGLLPEQKKGVVMLTNADHGFPFILMEVGEGVASLLAGQQPEAIHFSLLPWMMRGSLLIPLFQSIGILSSLRSIRRWRLNPANRPSKKRMWGQYILLPLVPNFTLASILAYLRSSGLLRFMHLYMPDLAWIARVSGGLAGIWGFLRTGLVLRALRRPSSPEPVDNQLGTKQGG